VLEEAVNKTYKDFSVIGKRGKRFIQRLVHFRGGAFKETATSYDV
jgi:hypothetical protein